MSKRVAVVMLLVVLAATIAASTAPQAPSPSSVDFAAVNEVRSTFEALVGPVPAVATTPFFTLALLTGLSLVADVNPAPPGLASIQRQLRQSPLIAQTRPYATWWVFGTLCLLTVIVYLSNSGKLQGTIGKVLKVAEAAFVLVAYSALAGHALMTAAPSVSHAPTVLSAGVFGGASAVGYGVILLLSLYTLVVTRLALDFAIWLSPFPLVDFAFESVKKIMSLVLLLVYFLSPGIALAISVMTILISALMLGWAIRFLRFGWSVLLNPLLAVAIPSLRPGIGTKLETFSPAPQVPLSAAVAASVVSVRGLRKRQMGMLACAGDQLYFVRQRTLRRPTVTEIRTPETSTILARRLMWTELHVVDKNGRILSRVGISKAVPFTELMTTLGAADGGNIGTRRWLAPAGRVGRDGIAAVSSTVSSVLGPAISGASSGLPKNTDPKRRMES